MRFTTHFLTLATIYAASWLGAIWFMVAAASAGPLATVLAGLGLTTSAGLISSALDFHRGSDQARRLLAVLHATGGMALLLLAGLNTAVTGTDAAAMIPFTCLGAALLIVSRLFATLQGEDRRYASPLAA